MIIDDRTTRRTFIKACAVLGAAAPGYRTLARTLLDAAGADGWRPQIGVCTSSGNAGVLKRAGASYIEDGVRRLLVPDKPDDVFESKREAALSGGVPIRACNGFLPGSLKCTGPDANHEGVLAFSETAFARARKAGVETICFGSSGARSIPEGFSRERAEQQFVELLRTMGELAGRHGVTVAVEPLNRGETNFINTLPEGVRIVERVGHPAVGLTADIFHMTREEEPAQNILDAGSHIRHAHIAENRRRTCPGVDGQAFHPYLQALKQIGYAGPISIESRWDGLEQQLPTALATLDAQLRDLDDVVVLFDGSDLDHWAKRDGKPAEWTLTDGAMEVAIGKGSIESRRLVRDFRMHLEFRTPKHDDSVQGQARGNSGVYIQRRYEVQILDSYGLESGPRDCASLYGVRAPDKNACRPPGEWQTYDIVFREPRWDGVEKTADARITVHHNGVLVHDDVEVPGKTGAGLGEGPDPQPILLQDHGNPVQFRNIWIQPLTARDGGAQGDSHGG